MGSVPSPSTIQLPMKRLVICCDGTWVNSDSGTKISLNPFQVLSELLGGKVQLQSPSNVTRIGRCVRQLDTKDPDHPIQQITYYQAGIGTQNLEDKFLGGATGFGLAEHIREAYQFIAANYNKDTYNHATKSVTGDEIFLTGFSRGAFTARSIAAFINDIGLLTKVGMMHFYPIFVDWENQQKTGWKVPFPDDPFKNHGSKEYNLFDKTGKERYVKKLVDLGMTVPNVKVKAVAVWDTVGSLGLPRLGIFDTTHHESLDYAFVDTGVPGCVENAIHAISLDENRKPFTPTIWEKPSPGQTLNQVWFAGAHADVGGSYDDSRAADITLVWMISQLGKLGLEFNREVLKRQFFEPQGEEKKPLGWGCGPIHNEFKGIHIAGGAANRTPLAYVRYDHSTGLPRVPQEPLQETNEKIHSSVRIRGGRDGKDHLGNAYVSPALKGWRVEGVRKDVEGANASRLDAKSVRDGQKGILWTNGTKSMAEEEISDLEWELIQAFRPDVGQEFLSVVPRS